MLEHCARLGELRTFHGLVVVLGHSRRPTAVALKRIVRDDRLSPSPLFRDAREVEMTYTHTPPYSNTTGEREEYCIGDSKLKTSPLHRCLVALTEAAWAGDYEVYDDDDEEIPDGILAARRAAAMQQVGATAVYHGVASIEGTNEDVGGYETVALLSVARPEARCLPGAVEPPRVRRRAHGAGRVLRAPAVARRHGPRRHRRRHERRRREGLRSLGPADHLGRAPIKQRPFQ